MRCPMPIVQLAMAIRKLAIGDELEVEATDPAFLPDAQAWSRMTGNELCETIDGAIKKVRVRRLK